MNCGSPGSEWCEKCEESMPGCGPDGQDFYDMYAKALHGTDGPFTKVLQDYCTQCGNKVDPNCACERGRAKADGIRRPIPEHAKLKGALGEQQERMCAPLPPDCDCRQPAPVKGRGYGAWQGLECAGCRGKVSLFRIVEEKIKVRES